MQWSSISGWSSLVLLAGGILSAGAAGQSGGNTIDQILSHAQPLSAGRGERFPLFLWHLRGTRTDTDDEESRATMSDLATRGLVVVPAWTNDSRRKRTAMDHAIRMARLQNEAGLPAYAFAGNTGAGFYSDPKTWHVDEAGERFTDLSHVEKIPLGCPFENSGWDRVASQVREWVRAYKRAGVRLDGLWFDWEGDGPSEWNEAWAASRRCVRCWKVLGESGLTDFRVFQKKIRRIRSSMQNLFVDAVHADFPEANVANYGVYPQGGHRYWWDWYERMVDATLPARREHRAVYREWFPEFPLTGFTIGMPVVYGWDRIFAEYEFPDTDYRWFYNMLLVFSDSARRRPDGVPLVPFVSRFVQVLNMKGIRTLPGEDEIRGGIRVSSYEVAEDAPADTKWVLEAKRDAVPLSEEKYRELLWHMWLRGADGMYVWSAEPDMLRELVPVHEVYAAALEYREFLERGTPVTFDVPEQPGVVVSALKLGDRLLVRRTDFGTQPDGGSMLQVDGRTVMVPPTASGRTMVIPLPTP